MSLIPCTCTTNCWRWLVFVAPGTLASFRYVDAVSFKSILKHPSDACGDWVATASVLGIQVNLDQWFTGGSIKGAETWARKIHQDLDVVQLSCATRWGALATAVLCL